MGWDEKGTHNTEGTELPELKPRLAQFSWILLSGGTQSPPLVRGTRDHSMPTLVSRSKVVATAVLSGDWLDTAHLPS